MCFVKELLSHAFPEWYAGGCWMHLVRYSSNFELHLGRRFPSKSFNTSWVFFGIPNPHLKLQGSQGGVCWSRFDVDLELPNVQQGCQQLGGGWHEDHGCQEVTNLHLFSQSHGTYLQGMLAKNPGGWGLDVARAMIFGVKLWDSNILLPSALWCCIVWLSTFFSQPSIFLTVWIVLISYDPPQTYRSLRDFT